MNQPAKYESPVLILCPFKIEREKQKYFLSASLLSRDQLVHNLDALKLAECFDFGYAFPFEKKGNVTFLTEQ